MFIKKVNFIIFTGMFELVCNVKNVSDILKSIRIQFGDSEKNISSFEQCQFMPYYPGIRARIDLTEYIEETKIDAIEL
jgi:hypothetical protein